MDDASQLAFLATASAAPVEQEPDAHVLPQHLLTSPLITHSALKHHAECFPSLGLFGTSASDRVYVNTNAPSSTVICGVEGSGKSHTVSCFLENALIPDPRIGKLAEPQSALVFHVDEYDSGRPCEAAFLSMPNADMNAGMSQVTVLCSPSNFHRRRDAYAALPQVRVEPLWVREKDLSADRMLALMGRENIETLPLYHTALRLIRQTGMDAFNYSEFRRKIGLEPLNAGQKAMFELRMDPLDEFIRPYAPDIQSHFSRGGLVLIDLTDPFLDGLTAAILFDLVLESFTQWESACEKLVVLDAAHKYLTNDSARLIKSLINTIRLQQHLATRIIIATQDPTVVPATILDLASTIVCHRFSSPAWAAHLARHVSAGSDTALWYEQVALLENGEALVFSPAAAIADGRTGGVALLRREHLRLRVRPRLTQGWGPLPHVLAVERGVAAAAGGVAERGSRPSFESPTPEAVPPAQWQETDAGERISSWRRMTADGPAPPAANEVQHSRHCASQAQLPHHYASVTQRAALGGPGPAVEPMQSSSRPESQARRVQDWHSAEPPVQRTAQDPPVHKKYYPALAYAQWCSQMMQDRRQRTLGLSNLPR
ncbi:hypothetical protein B0H15DRAFT_847075 [Mycena belliarum]|uniref:Uncharacterized protein n=1 Tax=Mycena belliarum TaxID=1033014 RepID=A0AAD6U057_9AGAR|nr:hypothetical protein B0H15DRAFT_847075 [Mycena belliae]